MLFIFGGLFAKELSPYTGAANSTGNVGKVAANITYLFGAMAIYIGLAGVGNACCFTRCPKLSKCCSFFVSIREFSVTNKERQVLFY